MAAKRPSGVITGPEAPVDSAPVEVSDIVVRISGVSAGSDSRKNSRSSDTTRPRSSISGTGVHRDHAGCDLRQRPGELRIEAEDPQLRVFRIAIHVDVDAPFAVSGATNANTSPETATIGSLNDWFVTRATATPASAPPLKRTSSPEAESRIVTTVSSSMSPSPLICAPSATSERQARRKPSPTSRQSSGTGFSASRLVLSFRESASALCRRP